MRAAPSKTMRLLAALCVLLLLGAALLADAAKAVKPLPQSKVKQPPRKDLSKKMERLNTVDMMIAVRACVRLGRVHIMSVDGPCMRGQAGRPAQQLFTYLFMY